MENDEILEKMCKLIKQAGLQNHFEKAVDLFERALERVAWENTAKAAMALKSATEKKK